MRCRWSRRAGHSPLSCLSLYGLTGPCWAPRPPGFPVTIDHSTELVSAARFPGVWLSLDSPGCQLLCRERRRESRVAGTGLLCAQLRSVPAPDGGASPSLNSRQALKLSGQVGSLWRLLGVGMGRREANTGPFESLQEHSSKCPRSGVGMEARVQWDKRSLDLGTVLRKVLENIYLPTSLHSHRKT